MHFHFTTATLLRWLVLLLLLAGGPNAYGQPAQGPAGHGQTTRSGGPRGAAPQHGAGRHKGMGPQHMPARRVAGPGWGGRIERFHERDWQTWRGGHWERARHGGRVGWWWVVGPAWYFYTVPAFPYPSPWLPPDVIETPVPDPDAPPPSTEYWYYCEALRNYYPYVARCPGAWVAVPAHGPAP